MSVSPGERSFTAKITTNAIDRDKEVLLPEGMDATDFEKSPSIFWAHDYFQLPLGKAVALKRFPNHWLAKGVMAERPDTHPEQAEWFPDTVLSLMEQGVIKGVSVGFDPVTHRKPNTEDRRKFGEGVQNVVSRWRLLEYSIAPMPANQDALVEAVGKGALKPSTAKAIWGPRGLATKHSVCGCSKAAPSTEPAEPAEPAKSAKSAMVVVMQHPKPAKRRRRATMSDIESAVAKRIAHRQGKIWV